MSPRTWNLGLNMYMRLLITIDFRIKVQSVGTSVNPLGTMLRIWLSKLIDNFQTYSLEIYLNFDSVLSLNFTHSFTSFCIN